MENGFSQLELGFSTGKDYPSKVSLFLWAKDIVNRDEMADLKNIYIFLTDIEAVNLV